MKCVVLFVFVLMWKSEANFTKEENCNVISIEEWSGSSSRRLTPLPKPIPVAVIQHTYVYECNSDEECVDALKKIRNMHTEIMGFDDIGNSFYIGGNGKVYEGAGWNRIGAHTRFYNGRSIGISFIGDFTKKLPTKTALQAAKDLLTCGEEFGYLSSNFSLYGHLQLSPTESPGEDLYEEIQRWPHWREDISKL